MVNIRSKMKSRFPDLTLFIDAAGRYSHSKEAPIVFGGVAVETRDVNEIRDSLLAAANCPLNKWSNGKDTKKCAEVIFRLLGKRQLLGFVRVVSKNTPEWDTYFVEGRRLYEIAIRKAQRSVPFAKPMATFKLHQLAILCGDLIGFFANRNRHRIPHKDSPIQPFAVTAVFDSDIHGEINQHVFKDVFARADPELKRTHAHLRISPRIKAEIKTEQEEPLLLLADYLAGYHYSRAAYQAQQEKNWMDIMTAVRPMVEKMPAGCQRVMEIRFREKYFIGPNTFDDLS